MNSLDPGIINYSNLNSKDKVTVRAKLDVLNTVLDARDEYRKDMKGKITLSRIMYESAIEALDEIAEKVKLSIIKTMADMIDDYDCLVEEYDTDDYFYGLESDEDE